MCGRGRQTAASVQAVAQALQIPVALPPPPPTQNSGSEEEEDEYSPFSNGAPGRNVPIVTQSAAPSTMAIARWGLVPHYQSANTPPDFWRMFNAREDNMVNVHASLINSKRCIIPLEGFFEWQNKVDLGKKVKIPYYVTSPKGSQLCMAGLYDTWHDSKGRSLTSCTIITVSPSNDLKWLHDRMPAILQNEDEMKLWLDPNVPFSKVKHLIRPYMEGGLKWWPVTNQIGHLGYQGDDCIKPVDLLKGNATITSFFTSTKKTKGSDKSSQEEELKKENPKETEEITEAVINDTKNDTEVKQGDSKKDSANETQDLEIVKDEDNNKRAKVEKE